MGIVIVINVAVTTCGLILSILSSVVYFSVAPLRRDKKEDLETLFAVYCACVVVLGILITIAGLASMMIRLCPAVDTVRCTRKIYPIALGVCSVALIAGSVLCMIVSPQASRSLSTSFNEMFGNAESGHNNSLWHIDQLQRERECCGIRPPRYEDVANISSNRQEQLLPKSCCPPMKKAASFLENDEDDDAACQWWNSYKTNCLVVFRYTFDRAINNVAMWALSVVTFLIVAVVLIICTTPR